MYVLDRPALKRIFVFCCIEDRPFLCLKVRECPANGGSFIHTHRNLNKKGVCVFENQRKVR